MTGHETTEQQVEALMEDMRLNRRHLLVFLLCGAGLFFESLNLQLMSFVAPMVAREWGIGAKQIGVTISAAIFGMMAGTYLFGALADRFGRRATFQATVGLFSVLTALSGFATSLWQLLVARFGAGIGIGGSIPVETAVLAEFTPARWRGRVMALWATALPLGGLVAPLCVAAVPGDWGWRALLFLGGVPALLVLLVRRVIPETPHFLASKGHLEEARRALDWIAMKPPGSSVIRIAPGSPAPSAAPERVLIQPAYRSATLTAWALNFGSFFAYYGFVLWLPALLGTYRGLPTGEVISFMLGLALAGLFGRLTLMLLADRVRLERLILMTTLGAAFALAGFAFQAERPAMMLWGYAAAFLLEGVFSAAIPFVAQIYPAQVRATGVGWAGGMGRLEPRWRRF